MSEEVDLKIKQLEQSANQLKADSNNLEALRKFEEILDLKYRKYGDGSHEVRSTKCEIAILCNILSMDSLQNNDFELTKKLLKKAEKLAEKDYRVLACTFNNYGCLFRKTKKLRSALTFLLKALEIEYKHVNESDNSVDDELITSNPCDIHLNICAILSQMDKHDIALQHAMKALILIQDEIINRIGTEGDKTPSERLVVLSIAYHNIGVEYEFLKKYQQALNAYKKSVINAETHLGPSNLMTVNMRNVYDKAINKIADVILKTVSRKGAKNKSATKKNNIIEMLDDGMSEEEIINYLTKTKEKKE
ncbi:unnamed protein product [Moneuplotes crassus]|uniref:Uncharacterized protein n=1 Tax=Euplotes crassus TaxID=5936 RepID=A0AAD2D1X4_EUPCR|nr:unnamed protein product [Moneuplotes crassus]